MFAMMGCLGCAGSQTDLARPGWSSEAVAALGPGIPGWQRVFLDEQGAVVVGDREIVTVFMSTREWPTVEVVRRAWSADGAEVVATVTRVADHRGGGPIQTVTTALYATRDSEAIARYAELLENRFMLLHAPRAGEIDVLGQASLILVRPPHGPSVFVTESRAGQIAIDVPTYDLESLIDMMSDPYSRAEQAGWSKSARDALAGDWRAVSVWCELLDVFDAAVVCLQPSDHEF